MKRNRIKCKFVLVIMFIFTVSGCLTAQTKTEKMSEIPNFVDVIEDKLKSYGRKLNQICPIETDPVAYRVFKEYGAIFVSNNGGKLPGSCIFDNDPQVASFQAQINPKTAVVGGISITLQEPAMNALLEAIKVAAKQNLRITPRGGSIAAARSYQDTAGLWNSRFYPALNYWVGKGKIARQTAENTKRLPIRQQVAQVLEWESKGLFFSKDLSKSILFSVAAPGASQHIFMLALDVEQFNNKKVREILADHGWFQTVKSDLPHFTFLGVKETELKILGLKDVYSAGQKFWIPNLEDE